MSEASIDSKIVEGLICTFSETSCVEFWSGMVLSYVHNNFLQAIVEADSIKIMTIKRMFKYMPIYNGMFLLAFVCLNRYVGKV